MSEAVESTAPESTGEESTNEESLETQSEETTEEVSEQDLSAEDIQELEEKVEEAKRLKKLLLKVDGEELEEELPFEITEEQADWMRNQLQLAKVAQKRMQESSMTKKQLEERNQAIQEFILQLKEDPRSILMDERIGVDIKALAQQVMNEELEEQAKSPEQKALEQAQRDAEEARKRLKEIEEQRISAERQAEQEKLASEMENGIMESIEANGLKKDPRVLKRYADAMRAGLKYNIKLTPQDVGPIIKEQLYEEAKFYMENLSDDEFEDFAGKDRISRVRKSMLAKLKKKVPSAKEIKDTGKTETVDPFAKKAKKIKAKDFFKNLK